jgi:hypothetical protein
MSNAVGNTPDRLIVLLAVADDLAAGEQVHVNNARDARVLFLSDALLLQNCCLLTSATPEAMSPRPLTLPPLFHLLHLQLQACSPFWMHVCPCPRSWLCT